MLLAKQWAMVDFIVENRAVLVPLWLVIGPTAIAAVVLRLISSTGWWTLVLFIFAWLVGFVLCFFLWGLFDLVEQAETRCRII